MKEVAVTGASGMLGKAVCGALAKSGYTWCRFERAELDITNRKHVDKLRGFDAVINCAGVREGPDTVMVDVNAFGPHVLARNFDGRIIHVSTDCVFYGALRTKHAVGDPANPTTLYGRSKLAGESFRPGVVNVRTSFIGFDHGLLRWLINSQGHEVPAYTHTGWSGSDVWTVAEALVSLVEATGLRNVEHLATEDEISKARLLDKLRLELDLDVKLKSTELPVIYRALRPTIVLPPVNYERLRHEFERIGSNPGGSVSREREVVS